MSGRPQAQTCPKVGKKVLCTCPMCVVSFLAQGCGWKLATGTRIERDTKLGHSPWGEVRLSDREGQGRCTCGGSHNPGGSFVGTFRALLQGCPKPPETLSVYDSG